MAGQIHEWRGDTTRAAAFYQETTALDGGNPNGRHSLGVLRCRTGAIEEGLALLVEARRLSHDDPLIIGDLGWCYASGGRPDEARALLTELVVRARSDWVSPVALAVIHVGLGEHAEALDQLERAYEQRAYRIVQLTVDARWDPIRSDPRFRALVRQVGLPEGPLRTASAR
jgi:Flp pilus assembly protein TadD